MPVLSPRTYEQAVGARLPWWRLEISNWGNRATGADATSIVFPASGQIRGGAAALLIGPDSTADEAIVTYSEPFASSSFNPAPAPGNLNQLSRTFGIVRPGLSIPGPMSFRTAFSTQFTDTYFKDGNAAAQPFGLTNPQFEAPLLQLDVYIQTPNSPILTTKRNDLYRHTEFDPSGIDVGSEATVAIFPVMGRGCKSVYVRATGTIQASVRVGGIMTFVRTQAGVPVDQPVEDTVTSVTVNANTGIQESITTGRPMQWLSIYATRIAGAGLLEIQTRAEDC